MTEVNTQVKKVVEDEIRGSCANLNPILWEYEFIFYRLDLAWIFSYVYSFKRILASFCNIFLELLFGYTKLMNLRNTAIFMMLSFPFKEDKTSSFKLFPWVGVLFYFKSYTVYFWVFYIFCSLSIPFPISFLKFVIVG